MQHVIASKHWGFGVEPFPAYRANLVFGRNKHARTFLTVKGVTPNEEDGLLPDGQFKVIKTKAKGTIMIVGGQDNSDRILFMVSASGGFRGGVRLLQDVTDGQILAQASASNACDSAIAVAALLEVGQRVVFHSYGRRTNDVIVYAATPAGVERRTYTLEEWRAHNTPVDEVEEL